ncbi:MAG: hypothetical protein ACLTTH_15850 [Holdemanella porci]
MVINVITRHAPTNYGSLLQAIATQRVIMNLGHECRIINYIPKCETGVRMPITQLEQKTKWRRNPIKKAVYLMVAEPETLLMDRKFLAMRKKYLLMGPYCATTGELKKLYAEKRTKFFLPEAIRCGDLSLPDITIQLIFLILSRKVHASLLLRPVLVKRYLMNKH